MDPGGQCRASQDASGQGAGRVPPPSSRSVDGWVLWEYEVVTSTNDVASSLPPWSAVRADRQTAGRGRHQRGWVSDDGGLWMSAVVPTGTPEQGWAALPLAAGLAVCEALDGLGVRPLRLRWPNDLLSGRRKLAGLLVDQFQPGRAVVGLGLNVSNRPELADSSLAGNVVRLSDLVPVAPPPAEVAPLILRRLRGVVEAMHEGGFASLADQVNARWSTGHPLEIEAGGTRSGGLFLGVDGAGRLRVQRPDGGISELGAHEVVRMRELE